jgi:hypothetical protein
MDGRRDAKLEFAKELVGVWERKRKKLQGGAVAGGI